MAYNLESPNSIAGPIDFENPSRWIARETLTIQSPAIRDVFHLVAANVGEFVRWPSRAVLLWQGCDRVPLEGEERKYHNYPEAIRKLAKERRVKLDARPNGPAIAAFLLAGGIRPERFGSLNAWSIHHLYSGKFPYAGRKETKHAIKDCNHFTQSAGLVATHPIADGLSDEFPCFAWLLRAMAYKRFGYDPDGVFSPHQDTLGFTEGHGCDILVQTKAAGGGS